MLIFKSGEKGELVIERVPELPSNYRCKEWKAYERACVEAERVGETEFTEKQRETFAHYRKAQERNFR